VSRFPARRVFTGISLVLVAALLPSLTTSAANADDSSTLTVVGTSDVSDSNLMADVIQPGFEAAFPGITLNYVPKGTGAAITYAEAGTASALLVHAPSLENSYVSQGFSLEKYGRAVFWGDYVLLGPPSDPAHVMTGTSSENIVQAFQKIAAAGTNGKANFVSRGGTPGTTIQEHAIWALTQGVTTCTVSDTNGGGTSPSTTTGACPDSISYPDWYHATGLTQAPNITAGDTCNFPGAGPGDANNCYVFTDRGTFNYMESQHEISTLQIVTNDNDKAQAGQKNLLVNSFHLYGVNPAAVPPGSQINTAGAADLLSWLTSPSAQAAVANYLHKNGTEPFRPDASPTITSSAIPGDAKPGDKVILTGAVTNVVPGTPALNDVKVTLSATVGPSPQTVKSVRTGADGHFAMAFHRQAHAVYTLSTPAIQKVEYPDLTPVFGDLLARSSKTVQVRGVPTLTAKPAGQKRVEVSGRLAPKVTGSGATLELLAAHPGKPLRKIASRKLTPGQARYDDTFMLGQGKWTLKVRYSNPGVILAGSSTRARVSLG
jgi:tungstate transport system substrate-binding protein